MRKRPKADPKLLEYLPERDMLVVQRRCLLDDHEEKRRERRRRRHGLTVGDAPNGKDERPAVGKWIRRKPAASAAGEPVGTSARKAPEASADGTNATPVAHPTKDDPKLPPLLYSFDVIYRYTRGVNDISNPGMGYGELTKETRWAIEGKQLTKIELTLRRTRTGRQEVTLPDDKSSK